MNKLKSTDIDNYIIKLKNINLFNHDVFDRLSTHSFKRNNYTEENLRGFNCVKCGGLAVDIFYGDKKYDKIKPYTCEEYIIKSIIE